MLKDQSQDESCPVDDGRTDVVEMPAELYGRLIDEAQRFHAAGLKAFGVFVGDPRAAGHPFRPVDVVIFNPRRNRRNEPGNLAAFHAQGSYFRQFDDAGFVADSTDLLHVWRSVEAAGLEIIAPFHVHRRQPANFSTIDYRLHNPAFAWHLIVSLRDPRRPVVAPFSVIKEPSEFGIDERDGLEGSELAYQGREVAPIPLRIVEGTCGAMAVGKPAAEIGVLAVA